MERTVHRKREDHRKIARISTPEIDLAIMKSRGPGYGRHSWRPGQGVTFDQRREIIQVRLRSGFPSIKGEFATLSEGVTAPLEGEDERTTIAAFLIADKERESVKGDSYRCPKLWNLHVKDRRKIRAKEEQKRLQLCPPSLSTQRDLLRPNIAGPTLRANQHLRRYFRVFHEQGIIVISNVAYVPELPPHAQSATLNDDGHYGYHEATWFPQRHEGRWHMPFCPSFAARHSDLRSDMAWYKPNFASESHFDLVRAGQYRLSPGLLRAVRMLRSNEAEQYALCSTNQAGSPQHALDEMNYTAGLLSNQVMSQKEILALFGRLQRSVLELRGWQSYENALAAHQRLVRRIETFENWTRAADVAEINTDYRGVFVTDFETANIYGHLQVPVWWMRGMSTKLLQLLKERKFVEVHHADELGLPVPVLTPMHSMHMNIPTNDLYEDCDVDRDAVMVDVSRPSSPDGSSAPALVNPSSPCRPAPRGTAHTPVPLVAAAPVLRDATTAPGAPTPTPRDPTPASRDPTPAATPPSTPRNTLPAPPRDFTSLPLVAAAPVLRDATTAPGAPILTPRDPTPASRGPTPATTAPSCEAMPRDTTSAPPREPPPAPPVDTAPMPRDATTARRAPTPTSREATPRGTVPAPPRYFTPVPLVAAAPVLRDATTVPGAPTPTPRDPTPASRDPTPAATPPSTPRNTLPAPPRDFTSLPLVAAAPVLRDATTAPGAPTTTPRDATPASRDPTPAPIRFDSSPAPTCDRPPEPSELAAPVREPSLSPPPAPAFETLAPTLSLSPPLLCSQPHLEPAHFISRSSKRQASEEPAEEPEPKRPREESERGKADHWYEADPKETEVLPFWFPQEKRWPDVPAVDRSTSRMDTLFAATEFPVKFVKGKLLHRSPRPLLFANKPDDKLFGIWLIWRDEILKHIVTSSVNKLPGLPRAHWRRFMKVNLDNALAREVCTQLGLGFMFPADAAPPDEPMEDVQPQLRLLAAEDLPADDGELNDELFKIPAAVLAGIGDVASDGQTAAEPLEPTTQSPGLADSVLPGAASQPAVVPMETDVEVGQSYPAASSVSTQAAIVPPDVFTVPEVKMTRRTVNRVQDGRVISSFVEVPADMPSEPEEPEDEEDEDEDDDDEERHHDARWESSGDDDDDDSDDDEDSYERRRRNAAQGKGVVSNKGTVIKIKAKRKSKSGLRYKVKGVVYALEDTSPESDHLKAERQRHKVQPADWYGVRAHFYYFYEIEPGMLVDFDKSHEDFDEITSKLECWFDFKRRRRLYFQRHLRSETSNNALPSGECLLKKDAFDWCRAGRDMELGRSRRIWPFMSRADAMNQAADFQVAEAAILRERAIAAATEAARAAAVAASLAALPEPTPVSQSTTEPVPAPALTETPPAKYTPPKVDPNFDPYELDKYEDVAAAEHLPALGAQADPESAPGPAPTNIPWLPPDHGLELGRLAYRMASSRMTFDGHPLELFSQEGRLTDEWRAHIVWELREIEFRNGLYTVDFVIRQTYRQSPLSQIDRGRRRAQLHECWGGGNMKPDESRPSPYSLRDKTPQLLRALEAMFDFMEMWPRAGDFLKRPVNGWTIESTDRLASMVFHFYAQTYFDYLRCIPPMPYVRPPLPWNSNVS